MEYNIFLDAKIRVADETALKNMIETIQTFIANQSGTCNFNINTNPE